MRARNGKGQENLRSPGFRPTEAQKRIRENKLVDREQWPNLALLHKLTVVHSFIWSQCIRKE